MIAYARADYSEAKRPRWPTRCQLVVEERAVCRGTDTLQLTRREMELLCFLAMHDAPVPVDVLAEAMVPQKDCASASLLLRVLIARVRKKCGREIVEHSRSGYRLGAHVEVPWREIASRLHESSRHTQLGAGELVALRRDLARVRRWLQGPLPAWEWAAQCEGQWLALEDAMVKRLSEAAEAEALTRL